MKMKKTIILIVFISVLILRTALAGDFYENELKYPISAKSKANLTSWFEEKSFGEIHTQSIKTRKSEVFLVETFPYSGIRASHLYLYQKIGDAYEFFCFYWLITGDMVTLTIDQKTDEVLVQNPSGKSIFKFFVAE